MSETEIQPSPLSDPSDAELAQYQAVSGLAVAGLIVALAAPAALIHPLLWTVPFAGILVSALALERIARNTPALIGRKAALAGLVVSVLCAALALSEWFAYRRLIEGEARQFAAQAFEFFRQGEPYKAHQVGEPPQVRLPLDEGLEDYYSQQSEPRRELMGYCRRPEIRSLLALGDKARVRYYDTEGWSRSGESDSVRQVYAVTWEEVGGKKSFLIGVNLIRHRLHSTGRAHWQVASIEGPIRPKAMGGEKQD